MANRIHINRGRIGETGKQNIPGELKRKENKKNRLWEITFKESKKGWKNTENKIEMVAEEKTLKIPRKIKSEEVTDRFVPVFSEIRNVEPVNEKKLLSVASNLVKNIYTGLNASGNRELVLTMMPSLFRDTHIRIEKIAKARVRIIIESKNPFTFNFFNRFCEDIKAGLVMRGLMIDEFKIKR